MNFLRKTGIFLLFVATFLPPSVVADPIPPLPPEAVTALPEGDGAINITWMAPPGDIVDYVVYRNGEILDRTTETWFLDDSPAPLGVYTVTATDGDGDESAPGGPAVAGSHSGACIILLDPIIWVSPSGCQDEAVETVTWGVQTVEKLIPIDPGLEDILEQAAASGCLTYGSGGFIQIEVGTIDGSCADLVWFLVEWAFGEAELPGDALQLIAKAQTMLQ